MEERGATRSPSALRAIIAVTVALPLAAACDVQPLVAPAPGLEVQRTQRRPADTRPKLDVLFMIDDSASMAEEQRKLTASFPSFIAELERAAPRLPDLHVAVVSSDLGAGGAQVGLTCGGAGLDGHFQATKVLPPLPGESVSRRTDEGCGLADGRRFIRAPGDGPGNLAPGRDLAGVFSCLAERGVGFCGYEHQLASVRRALAPPPLGQPANAGFLRPEAYLAVVLITDEDDCSGAPGSADFFLERRDGQEASYRCATEGHLCGGAAPSDKGSFSAPLSACAANPAGRLLPVATVVADLKALKPGAADRIFLAAIAGWPGRADAASARYRASDGDGTRKMDLLPICQTEDAGATTRATAAVRINELVSAFGDRGRMYSICEDDFRPVLGDIGRKIGAGLRPRCIEAPVVDVDPGPGRDVACVLSLATGTGAARREEALPRCDEAGTPSCWRPVEDTACAVSGLRYEVEWGEAGPPAGAEERLDCVGCTPGAPGCAERP